MSNAPPALQRLAAYYRFPCACVQSGIDRAFRNCRARAAAEAAGKPGDVHGVAAGSYVELHIADVLADAAQHVVQATAAFAQV